MSGDDCCDGYGRMTWSMVNNTRILGRDRKRRRVLLGGLGTLGLGVMWRDETGIDRASPEWDNAREIDEAEDVAAHGTLGGKRHDTPH